MKRSTAIITSSVNGGGLDIVRRFARQGFNVVLSASEQSRILHDKNIIPTIQGEFPQVEIMHVPADLKKDIDLHNLVEQTLDRFQRIDALIMNNECRRHYVAAIDEFPVEKWRDIIDINLTSTFVLAKTIWPHMKRQHFGRIINIASPHAIIPIQFKSACVTSHYAIEGLTRMLAIEGAEFGITANVICPGNLRTKLFDRYKEIQTLADVVLFLCTDRARSITGQSIRWSAFFENSNKL